MGAAVMGSAESPLIPLLACSSFGSHAAVYKGEDGLRVERILIGIDVVVICLVCDGHGGHEAALLVCSQVVEIIAKECKGSADKDTLKAAARSAFLQLDEVMQSDEAPTSGTTVTLCLLNETRGELTVCNLGDSFAILMPAHPRQAGMSSVQELTQSDRLEESAEECQRVRAEGGKLGHLAVNGQAAGPLRGSMTSGWRGSSR